MFAYTVAGLLVGVAVGLTGVGGGSLMTPLLILMFGFAPSSAVGTDLLFAAGTKTFGTWLHGRQQTVDWRIVRLMAIGSLPASVLTIVWLHLVGLQPWVQNLMVITLCGAMIATAILTLFRDRLTPARIDSTGIDQARPDTGLSRWLAENRTAITVAGGVALGVLVTLSSVGAGVLGTTMLLVLYPRIPAVRVVGTDIAHAVPLTLVAGLGHMSLGTIDPLVLGMLLLGSLPGIWLGTRFASQMSDRALRPVISVLLFLVALSMLWKILG